MYVIHKGMTYKCESCDATFTAKKRLMRHIRRKHEPHLKCDKCNFSANVNIDLKNHYIRDHGVTKEKAKARKKIHLCNE